MVVITGAGGGLGRAYALELAAHGAEVVVNDLGGSRDGSGSESSMADAVVSEIRAAGGLAVASYDSVATEDGAAAIGRTACNEFGAVQGIVNNAGILRDKAFHKMTTPDWEAVHSVHLTGGYFVTRAAWPHFRDQGFGRVVMATSTSGLFGAARCVGSKPGSQSTWLPKRPRPGVRTGYELSADDPCQPLITWVIIFGIVAGQSLCVLVSEGQDLTHIPVCMVVAEDHPE